MDANALVQHAELALQEARASGVRQLNYSAEKHSEMMARLALEQQLRIALERRQFVLHYQPKIDFATRRICGAEALLRWQDPQSGLVAPGAFLPVLESTGLILDVGAWVIEQAAQRLSRVAARRPAAHPDRREHLPGRNCASRTSPRSF